MGLSIFDLLALTCDSLRGNPLRSMLTTLGVFMGVAAVSATLQVGSISRAVIEAELAKREAPQVSLYVQTGDGTPLKLEDLTFLEQRLVGLKAISTAAYFAYDQVLFQDRQAELYIEAVSEHYLLTSGRLIITGRFFNQADFANYRPVVVIDEFLADQLFKGENPVNQRIYVAGRPYIVVGVMETKLRSKEDEPTGEMLVTLSLRNALTGRRNIGGLQLRPSKLEDLKTLEEQAKSLLLQRFPKGEFWAYNNADDILQQRQTLDLASQALLAVGGIALLVGGVGIANITIAAVIERTPEIGLRRAIGATQYDIMWQFILEAAILSLIGGVTAIGTVHGLTVMVSQTFELPYQFETGTAALALGSALLVGVGAGLLPAFRASQLDPVKALRSE
jgi:putative ABC transport system permease protein